MSLLCFDIFIQLSFGVLGVYAQACLPSCRASGSYFFTEKSNQKLSPAPVATKEVL
jgi:hypothetical protein